MSRAEVREATEADAAALVPLLHELGYPSEEEAVARRLATLVADEASDLWVAERDGTAVGFVSTYVNALVTRDATSTWASNRRRKGPSRRSDPSHCPPSTVH